MPNEETIQRCVNLDWLEVYALEPSTAEPHNADYFRNVGFHVVEREYGTPIYFEMFTLYAEDGRPLLEVRRNPKSASGRQINGVLDPCSTHIRLCNRTCYFENAANVMREFLQRYNYILIRISRIDLCLDFEKFDSGDIPQKFLQRYVAGKYSKLNQSNIALHGLDRWDGRNWNSVKWGNTKSMITTKLYNKTLELTQVSDKPYIRQAWYESGLIDDWHTCERYDQQGKPYKPEIWRLEFSIKSSQKNWFVIENPYNTKPKLRSIRHTLEQYETRNQMLDVFFSLCDHYFHFKKVEYKQKENGRKDRELKRKDRCADKVLFDKTKIATFYKLANIATNEKTSKDEDRLLRYLYNFQLRCTDATVKKYVTKVIAHLEERTHKKDLCGRLDLFTIETLRILIAKRMKSKDVPLEEDIKRINEMLEQNRDLFA